MPTTGKLYTLIPAMLLLAACGTDPGDVAAFERAKVNSAVGVGSSFATAQDALGRIGYSCKVGSGTFVAENRQIESAPTFLACSKISAKGRVDCPIHTQVIVVPDGAKVREVNFSAGDVCL